jgi:hypothetical protein
MVVRIVVTVIFSVLTSCVVSYAKLGFSFPTKIKEKLEDITWNVVDDKRISIKIDVGYKPYKNLNQLSLSIL